LKKVLYGFNFGQLKDNISTLKLKKETLKPSQSEFMMDIITDAPFLILKEVYEILEVQAYIKA